MRQSLVVLQPLDFVLVSKQQNYMENYVSTGNELSLSWNVQCC